MTCREILISTFSKWQSSGSDTCGAGPCGPAGARRALSLWSGRPAGFETYLRERLLLESAATQNPGAGRVDETRHVRPFRLLDQPVAKGNQSLGTRDLDTIDALSGFASTGAITHSHTHSTGRSGPAVIRQSSSRTSSRVRRFAGPNTRRSVPMQTMRWPPMRSARLNVEVTTHSQARSMPRLMPMLAQPRPRCVLGDTKDEHAIAEREERARGDARFGNK